MVCLPEHLFSFFLELLSAPKLCLFFRSTPSFLKRFKFQYYGFAVKVNLFEAYFLVLQEFSLRNLHLKCCELLNAHRCPLLGVASSQEQYIHRLGTGIGAHGPDDVAWGVPLGLCHAVPPFLTCHPTHPLIITETIGLPLCTTFFLTTLWVTLVMYIDNLDIFPSEATGPQRQSMGFQVIRRGRWRVHSEQVCLEIFWLQKGGFCGTESIVWRTSNANPHPA